MALCTPALIYFVLSATALVASLAISRVAVSSLLLNIFFISIWVWFLNHLCSTGNATIAWILLLLPFVIFVVLFALFAQLISNANQAGAVAEAAASAIPKN
jgi:hypothetical protein